MSRPPEGSEPIGFVSATSYERFRSCALRAAFARSGAHDMGFSAAATIGTLVHGVFEGLVRSGAISADDWSQQADDLWAEGLRIAASEAAIRDGQPVDPASWPDLNLKRARLRRSLVRLRSLLASLPVGSILLPEEPMQGLGGRLRGTADLIVRGPTRMIIDYKSGTILDDAEMPREGYVRQLHLYALMEHEMTGEWPDELLLMPLSGDPVHIPVSPTTSLDLGRGAMDRLAEYESRVPGPQPASVSVEVCATCPHAVDCPAFWSAYDATWGPWVIAVRGRIDWIQRSNGMATLAVVARDGAETTIVRGVDLLEHPGLAGAEAGAVVAVVGLRLEEDRGTTRPSPGTQLRVML